MQQNIQIYIGILYCIYTSVVNGGCEVNMAQPRKDILTIIHWHRKQCFSFAQENTSQSQLITGNSFRDSLIGPPKIAQ